MTEPNPDILLREAISAIPRGYTRVKTGEIQPTDGVWDWANKKYRRGSQWGPADVKIEECVCVVRRAG